MKSVARIAALAILLGAVAFWAVTGANRGWTKTSESVTFLDEITGIDGIAYQERFQPGVDFLGAAGLVSGLLWTASLLFRAKKQPTT